jgi:uncharacterized membrane protein
MRLMHNVARIGPIVVAAFIGSAGGQAPCAYDVLVVQFNRWIVGTDINNSSEACGFHYDLGYEDDRPFYWSAETGIVTLPLPPGFMAAKALGISENGDVVGYGLTMSEAQRAILWHDGIPEVLLEPSGSPATEAVAIAEHTAVGRGWGGDELIDPLRWDAGIVSPIIVPTGPAGEAMDVAVGSAPPHISGWMGGSWLWDAVGFVTDGEQTVDLGPVPGAVTGHGVAVSSAGHVAMRGTLDFKTFHRHSSLWFAGEYIDPGTLPGCYGTFAYDVNSHGGMVAMAEAEVYGSGGPVLWHQGRMRRLDEMESVDAQGVGPALAINDNWQITGYSAGHHSFAILVPIFGSPADATWDCVADIEDLLLLLGDWGPGDSPADFDDSGSVNVADLLFLLANWN